MIDFLGYSLSLMEVLTLLGIGVSLVAGWMRIDNTLKSIVRRNEEADHNHTELKIKVDEVERSLGQELAATKLKFEVRQDQADERLRAQDVSSGRVEERLNAMSVQLTRLLDLMEKQR